MQAINASASPEVQMNENFETLEWAQVYGKRQPTTTGLTWGYYGNEGFNSINTVRYAGQSFASGTLTLVNGTINYIVAPRGGGAPTVSTATTNWEDVVNYGRVYKITTASNVPTVIEDHRGGPFGIFSAPLTRNNFSVTSQAPAAATRTYITGSAIIIPVSKLRIGTMFEWVFDVTKTAAGAASSTIDIAVGTAGTTADTARVSFTKPAGTAVADHGRICVEAICRGPLSGSGVFSGLMSMTHNLENTGHMVIPCMTQNVQSGIFDVTVANLIVGLCITTGASDAITIQHVRAKAHNLG
jgi:hypothetical protein